MVEAYLFFYDQLEEFVIGTSTDAPLLSEVPLSQRLEECFHALKNAFQIVAIDLSHDDDAQVIFETLNARGEPLLPADLVRNYIFLRAARQGESQEGLYNTYWRRFDDEFWRVPTKQGRLLRPRSDLFMQHFLASKLTTDIPVKTLYVEYKFWIEKQHPFPTVEDELAVLSRQGDDFRRIISPEKSDPLYALAKFLDAYDVRTVYPLLLTILDAKIDETQWATFTRTLESYLLRRAVCGLTTKNYNRIFLSLTRTLRRDGVTHANLVKQLTSLDGESVSWPSDDEFREAWNTTEIYHLLNNPKLVHVLKRLNTTFIGDKMEDLSVESALTIEHILPQDWVENWPLQDGSTGMTREELWDSEEDQAQAIVTRSRNSASHRIGNLTILGQALNSGVSNKSWHDKKPQLLQHSLLPINQQLHDHDAWDETTIAKRGDLLFQRAIELWPFA